MPSVTPTFWQEKITEAFDMNEGKKQLHLNARKIDVNDSVFHLIIGLGGTGCKALLEAKGLIEQTCKGSSSRVACLAIDTSETDLKNSHSSQETGAVKLEDPERVFLDDHGWNGVFAPMHIEGTRANQPELFTWVDERIDPVGAGNGASGTRQVGRLILSKNFQQLVSRVTQAINKLSAGNVTINNPRLIVYILSGVSGGTGSGTFMDMPYVVRAGLVSAGFAAASTQLFGYLFTPDINKGNGASDEMLQRNAYAALQELDYNLSLAELNEIYDIYYPGHTYHAGTTGQAYYDKIHMISAMSNKGILMAKPLDHAVRAIAQSILSFVAKEEIRGDKFTVEDYYSNITAQATNLLNKLSDPHRYHQYIAIGSAEYELPIDDIMMYVASLLFDRMSEMFDQKPSGENISAALSAMGLNPDGLFDKLKAAIPVSTPPAQSYDALEKDKFFWLNKSAAIFEYVLSQAAGKSIEILNGANGVVNQYISRFNNYVQSAFQDPKRGPVYVNSLIIDGILPSLREFHRSLTQDGWIGQTPQSSPVMGAEVGRYNAAVNNMSTGLPVFGRSEAKNQRAAAVNSAGLAVYNKSIRLALSELASNLTLRLIEFVTTQNQQLFEMVVAVMRKLKTTFSQNADILTDDTLTVAPGKRTYTWEPLEIPVISHFVKQRFDHIIGPDASNMVQSFINDLWSKAQEWMVDPQRYDPQKFVSSFIDTHFADIAQASLETILTDLLTVPGTAGSLEDGIENTLMPWMEGEASPLYYPHAHAAGSALQFPVWRLISVPNNCTNIMKAVKAYCDKHYNGQYNLQASDIKTRIYMQTVTCGLSLSEFDAVWQAEKIYAANRNDKGLHLVHTKNSPHAVEVQSWNDLYTLIPSCRRPKGMHTPEVQMLIDEENERKQLFRSLVETNSPIAQLEQTNDNWILKTVVTKPHFEISGNELIWVAGEGDTRVELKRWTYATTNLSALKALKAELEALATGGLASLDGSQAAKRDVISRIVMNQVAGVPDSARTWDYLLEMCQCRYELVRNVRKEKAKYDVLSQYLAQVDAAYKKAYAEQMDIELYDFVKLLLNGDLMYRQNPADLKYYFSIKEYDPPYLRTLSATGINYQMNIHLYNAYSLFRNSDKPAAAPVRALLAQRQQAVTAMLSVAKETIDPMFRENMLKAIDTLNADAELAKLHITPGVSEDDIRFYEQLCVKVNALKSSLEVPAFGDPIDFTPPTPSPAPTGAALFDDL